MLHRIKGKCEENSILRVPQFSATSHEASSLWRDDIFIWLTSRKRDCDEEPLALCMHQAPNLAALRKGRPQHKRTSIVICKAQSSHVTLSDARTLTCLRISEQTRGCSQFRFEIFNHWPSTWYYIVFQYILITYMFYKQEMFVSHCEFKE